MSPTSAVRTSKAMHTKTPESSFWSKRVRFIKRRMRLKPERGWPLLPTPGKDEPPKQSMLSSATLNRRLPTTSWKEWHANSCAPPRCWNAPIGSYGASFVKSAALAVPRVQRSPSFYRSSGSMLAGRKRPGGRPPNFSSSSFSLSTLREGYATYQVTFLTLCAQYVNL